MTAGEHGVILILIVALPGFAWMVYDFIKAKPDGS